MKFKLGDRVRVIRTQYASTGLQVGNTGTILSAGPHCNQVQMDDYNGSFINSWSFNDRELQLVTEKRPSEVILEKLIEAKRVHYAAQRKRLEASKEEGELREKVVQWEARLATAINNEVKQIIPA